MSFRLPYEPTRVAFVVSGTEEISEQAFAENFVGNVVSVGVLVVAGSTTAEG